MSARTDFYARGEMIDRAEDLAASGRLGEFLRACEKHLLRPYVRADEDAKKYQKRYRWVVWWAAFLAIFTLAVDVGYLACRSDFDASHFCQCLERIAAWFALSPHSFLWPELLLAFLGVVLVLFGLYGRQQENWLLRRYQAERYRLLKFQFLIDPSLWGCGPERNWGEELKNAIDVISKLSHVNLEREAEREQVASISSPDACLASDPDDVSQLLEYYKRRRLAVQLRYFKRAAGVPRSVWFNPHWAARAFFIAMSLVIIRVLLELQGFDLWGWISTLAMLSILLPAWLAAFRLKVTANEQARNRHRSRARHSALQELAGRLGGLDETLLVGIAETVQENQQLAVTWVSARIPVPTDPSYVFSHLALAEQILSMDQHEWLRLMLEAEWHP